jgi:thiol-disulfide isomerase/thioredoxin
MKKALLLAVIAIALLCRSASAQEMANPTNELDTLILKVRADIQSGKRTEADLSGDLKQFDALLAKHKGEKTDMMAGVLYMKAQLYSEVIGDDAKADALIKQLKSEYSGTHFVTEMEAQQAKEAEAKKIEDSLAIGSPFPGFDEKDVMGQPVSIADFKGKVVMIDFWATWCPPCRAEIPNVVATYQKYHDKGFEVIGVSLDSDKEKLLNYTKENNMTWQQYFDGQGWGNKLAVKYGIESIPMTFLVDGNGKIIGKNLRGQELTDMVANAVAGK